MNDDSSAWGLFKAVVFYVLAWLGSWKVGELQAVAGVFSALAIGLFAALQAYVLWRDKVQRKVEADKP